MRDGLKCYVRINYLVIYEETVNQEHPFIGLNCLGRSQKVHLSLGSIVTLTSGESEHTVNIFHQSQQTLTLTLNWPGCYQRWRNTAGTTALSQSLWNLECDLTEAFIQLSSRFNSSTQGLQGSRRDIQKSGKVNLSLQVGFEPTWGNPHWISSPTP